MSNRKITLLEIPVKSDTVGAKRHIIKVELYFRAGGMSYGTYKQESKGLYLAAMPVIVEDHGSHQTELITAFSGIKQLVKPINRFSQKQLVSFTPTEEQLTTLVSHVLSKGSLDLLGSDEDTRNEDLIKIHISQYLEKLAIPA